MCAEQQAVTSFLRELRRGKQAFDDLMAVVYDPLRRASYNSEGD